LWSTDSPMKIVVGEYAAASCCDATKNGDPDHGLPRALSQVQGLGQPTWKGCALRIALQPAGLAGPATWVATRARQCLNTDTNHGFA
jgi:hypothetical protein